MKSNWLVKSWWLLWMHGLVVQAIFDPQDWSCFSSQDAIQTSLPNLRPWSIQVGFLFWEFWTQKPKTCISINFSFELVFERVLQMMCERNLRSSETLSLFKPTVLSPAFECYFFSNLHLHYNLNGLCHAILMHFIVNYIYVYDNFHVSQVLALAHKRTIFKN